MTTPRILFGVLSSRGEGELTCQLCTAVTERHHVLVHHDFSQQPRYAVQAPNVTVIRDYVKSDWGGWGQVEAIRTLLRTAVRDFEFDYFQLLSESCLPVRPLREFEEYLVRERPDASFEALPLDERSVIASLNYAYRYYPGNRIEKTIMRRLGAAALSSDLPRIEMAGLSLQQVNEERAVGRVATIALMQMIHVAQRRAALGGEAVRVGSTWFGVSRSTLQRMLAFDREHPELAAHFRHAQCADEGFLPTLIARSKPQVALGFNHFVQWTKRWTGPDELTIDDWPAIVQSGKFFARKLSEQPDDELRQRALERVRDARTQA